MKSTARAHLQSFALIFFLTGYMRLCLDSFAARSEIAPIGAKVEFLAGEKSWLLEWVVAFQRCTVQKHLYSISVVLKRHGVGGIMGEERLISLEERKWKKE